MSQPPVGQGPLTTVSFFTWGLRGSEWLSHLPKVTHVRSGRTQVSAWQPDPGVPDVLLGLYRHPPLARLRPVQGLMPKPVSAQTGRPAGNQAPQWPLPGAGQRACGPTPGSNAPPPACVFGHFQPGGFGGPRRACLVLADRDSGLPTGLRPWGNPMEAVGSSSLRQMLSHIFLHAVPGARVTLSPPGGLVTKLNCGPALDAPADRGRGLRQEQLPAPATSGSQGHAAERVNFESLPSCSAGPPGIGLGGRGSSPTAACSPGRGGGGGALGDQWPWLCNGTCSG